MTSKAGSVPNVFSPQTLEKFEAASASIPLRQLDRAFQGAGIRPGKDPGGPEGTRRAQFRRYLASIDQHDPRQLAQLGDVLGALIDEVAVSKQAYLVQAAQSDGFAFADGAFRAGAAATGSFAVTRAEDLALLDDRARRLRLLAKERPADAVRAATELVESVSRIVLHLSNDRLSPQHARLVVDAAVALAEAIAGAHLERAPAKRK
jgi:hypothetical protein